MKNEIARRVTQMYVLERLSRLDIATARDMLASLVPALERLSKVPPRSPGLYPKKPQT